MLFANHQLPISHYTPRRCTSLFLHLLFCGFHQVSGKASHQHRNSFQHKDTARRRVKIVGIHGLVRREVSHVENPNHKSQRPIERNVDSNLALMLDEGLVLPNSSASQPSPVKSTKSSSKKHAPACSKKCEMNCCCFFPWVCRVALNFVRNIINISVTMLSFLLSLEIGIASNQYGESKDDTPVDANAVKKYAVDVFLELIAWGFGVPSVALLLTLLHQRASSMLKSRRMAGKPRTDAMTEEQKKKMQADPQTRAVMELQNNASAKETERLGGVQDIITTKVSGMAQGQWLYSQFMSLGLFYFTMELPVTTSICVLGRSGRVLVLSKKPLMPVLEAAQMFRGIGLCIMMITELLVCWFRSIERSMLLAAKSKDPEVRAAAANAGGLNKAIVGKVWLFIIAAIFVQWIFFFLVSKKRLRSWGINDERNYYESKQACVAQYFRAGVRPLIPCLKRRKIGGMRMFFGPYPEAQIFGHLGKDFPTLKKLEPLLVLPRENESNGYPDPGNGQPESGDKSAEMAQAFLGFLNLILGSLGLFIFGAHIYNLFQNVQSCPVREHVYPCLHRDNCRPLSQSSWFSTALQKRNLLSPEEIAKNRMMDPVSINTIGIWLRKSTVEETKNSIRQLAQESCWLRYADLVSVPNITKNSPNADTLARFNAQNYLKLIEGQNITWDHKMLTCKNCRSFTLKQYLTNFENLIEVIEVLILGATCYINAVVYRLMTNKLTNCPMVDLTFESQPGIADDIDVVQLERQCLAMIGNTFFFRYHYADVPHHIQKLEQALQKMQIIKQTEKENDPWKMDRQAHDWNEYNLVDKINPRLVIVNRSLLGVLEGEEVVSAWSEAPRFSGNELFYIFGGLFFVTLPPLVATVLGKNMMCMIDTAIALPMHIFLIDYFILRRRPQAVFVLTSRRLFQVTRQPAFRDILGMTEPLLKLDVMIHNSAVSYASMTTEAYVPLWRRVLGQIKMFNLPVYRMGQVVVQSSHGIFRLRRDRGDTREVFHSLSKTSYLPPAPTLQPELGREFMATERKHREDKPQDPFGSCICCPNTPKPPATKGLTLLDRYCSRMDTEKDVYGRMLSMRPASCLELFCGRGCNCECSCCCCCQLDECLSDLIVTTHRTLIEQRAAQRYCGWCTCRKTPNIRVTFLGHNQAGAYLCDKPATAWGLWKLRKDLTIKLLPDMSREYPAGLMLHQKPYAIVTHQDANKDQKWMSHISSIYDIVTQEKAEFAENSAADRMATMTTARTEDDDWFKEEDNHETSEGQNRQKGKGKHGGKTRKGGGKDASSHLKTGGSVSQGKGKSKGKGKGGKSVQQGSVGMGKGKQGISWKGGAPGKGAGGNALGMKGAVEIGGVVQSWDDEPVDFDDFPEAGTQG